MSSLLPVLPRTYHNGNEKRLFSKLHPLYYTGLPIDQHYDLTLLKRSNIRSNDQLLPRPTEVDMTKLQIDQSFPAEHPYSSHMSRFALFPSFSNSPDDYKTGEAERDEGDPLHPQIPASPYGVTIKHKSKGTADRWETQDLLLDSQKRPLSWPGDVFFQNRKTPTSGQQTFYPIPPKAVLPTHAPRHLDFSIHPRTANALRNVERSQWVTTYSKNYTGYGPANALRLDNYNEKLDMEKKAGIENHNLRPRSYPTFMPPRPLEGRISRLIGPNQSVRCVVKDSRIEYVPFSPQLDIEMDKVPEYKNLPTETQESVQDPSRLAQWKKLQSAQNTAFQLRKLEDFKQQVNKELNVNEGKPEDEIYLNVLAKRRNDELEELTNRTRWKQAEIEEHYHDLRLLKRNVNYVTPHLQSPVYYDTLHKIYTNKPPFYYDGDNLYDYDYITPWEHHKTSALMDMYKLESAQRSESTNKTRPTTNGLTINDVQFAGYPGTNPYITPKYTHNQLLNCMRRLEASVAQKPPAQSNYTHSYDTDQMKSVITPEVDSRYDLSKSLPNMYTGSASHHTPYVRDNSSKTVRTNGEVQVANEGGGFPLATRTYRASERLRGTGTFMDYENNGSNHHVDTRCFNPDSVTHDPRLDWKPCSTFRPRSQCKLLNNMQNSCMKTDTINNFHQTFPENNPDLNSKMFEGKKHSFEGVNACQWH